MALIFYQIIANILVFKLQKIYMVSLNIIVSTILLSTRDINLLIIGSV